MHHDDIDFDEIISKYKADPYDYVDIHSIHTGRIRFKVEVGAEVQGVSGEWRHIPGTTLYVLIRERNPKPVHSPTNGEVSFIRDDLEGQFVEAGEKIITIKHWQPLARIENKRNTRFCKVFSVLQQSVTPIRSNNTYFHAFTI